MNQDRSPCAEELFKNSKEYASKSAGLNPHSDIPLTKQAIEWADVIFLMDERNEEHKTILLKKFPEAEKKDIRILNIPNDFKRFDSQLKELLKIKLEQEGFLIK